MYLLVSCLNIIKSINVTINKYFLSNMIDFAIFPIKLQYRIQYNIIMQGIKLIRGQPPQRG